MIDRLYRQAAAEALGTAGLALAAFGGGQLALSLGATKAEAAIVGTVAVAAALLAILHAIGPLTGGHVNPAVSWSLFVTGEISARELAVYAASQCAGAAGGALVANAMWTDSLASLGSDAIDGKAFVAEAIATFALVALIHGSAHGGNGNRLPVVVPAVVAGICFAAPFGIANPAITVAKTVVGGAWSPVTMLTLLVIELAVAMLAAKVMATLYAGERVESPPVAAADRLVTFEVQLGDGADRREEALEMALKVVERSLRPSDFAVRGRDGRLLVFVETTDEDGLAVLRQRIEENVRLAFLAADLDTVDVVRTNDPGTR